MKDPILRGSIPNQEYFLFVVKYGFFSPQFQPTCEVERKKCESSICFLWHFLQNQCKIQNSLDILIFSHFIAMNTLFVDHQMLRNTFCDSNKWSKCVYFGNGICLMASFLSSNNHQDVDHVNWSYLERKLGERT